MQETYTRLGLILSRFDIRPCLARTMQELCKKLACSIPYSCKNLLESYQNHAYTLHDSCSIFAQESYKFHDQDLAKILDGFLPRACQELLLGLVNSRCSRMID